MTSHNLTPGCRRRTCYLLTVLAAVFILTGCNATPFEKWETSMQVFTASNNIVATAIDEGRIKPADGRVYYESAKVVRAALDGWLLTISPDGKTDSGSARSAAQSALAEARAWIARTLTKQ